MVMLLNQPAAAAPVSSITTALLVLAPLMMTQFFSVSFTIGVVPIDPNRTTSWAPAEFVFVMVRLRSVPAPLTEPLMVTRLAPFSLISAEAAEPLTARAAPLGWMVIV